MLRYLLILILALPLQALAKPSELSRFSTDEAYSTASLRKLIFHAYDAEMWTDAKTWSYDAPFALTLTYRMGFSSEEIVERTFAEMDKQGTNKNYTTQYAQTLSKAFPNVRDGDRITAVFTPAKGVSFYYNGTPTGQIKDATFARAFFDIWLGENTSEPSLRNRLLKL